ncbi:MAG: FHA domain-containing protein [Candidatus Wallbacteria bacterium]|nr:FHA domain-containing protein [Candidatus Wallbacteria bacterium]
MAKIIIVRGQNRGMTYFVGARKVTIGRDATRTIPIMDGKASRLHAEILCSNDGFQLRDLGALNRTYLNGQEVKESLLEFGDVVTIGETDLLFQSDGYQPAPGELETRAGAQDSEGVATKPEVVLERGQAPVVGGLTIEMPRPDLAPLLRATRPSSVREAGAVKHERRLKVLWQMARTAVVKRDRKALLQEAVALLLPELAPDLAVVFLLEGEPAQPCPLVTHRSGALEPDESARVSSTVLERVRAEGLPLLIEDASRELSAQSSVSLQKIRSVLCVPLKTSEQAYGLFYADLRSELRTFSVEDLSFLATVCAHLSVNLENLELYRQSRLAYERLQQAQTQLIRAEKMSVMGQLSGSIAHELNSPLQAILMASEMLADDFAPGMQPPKPEAARKSLEMVLHAAARCRNLVKNLLHYARSKETSEVGPISLREPIDQAIGMMQYILGKRGVTLQAHYPAKLPLVAANAPEMEQVFVNLIKNSCDALDSSGRVDVTLATENSHVVVDVVDSGSGIPPEVLPRIFEELFTTKPEGQGTGLGLPLVKRIVERCGGSVEVRSVMGEGTTVELRLPIVREESAAA